MVRQQLDIKTLMRRSNTRWYGRAVGALLVSNAAACGSEPPREPAAHVTEWSCAESAVSEAPTRRLTRFEYANIVSDVFGVDNLDFEVLLPRDEVSLGFDNQAGALSVTDLHVEAYFKAAGSVAEAALKDPDQLHALTGCAEANRDCVERSIDVLAKRLLRRAPSERETAKLLDLFEDDFDDDGFDEGMHRVIAVLLQSPEFLYRFERATTTVDAADDPDSAEHVRLAPEVVASRLAFLYWGSGPDAGLYDAIDQGQLSTRAGVKAQAVRMLEDERSERGVLHFFEQWLELTDFDQVEKDRRLFSGWDDQVRHQLALETQHFFARGVVAGRCTLRNAAHGSLHVRDASPDGLLRAAHRLARLR
jgi:hypothetical protein